MGVALVRTYLLANALIVLATLVLVVVRYGSAKLRRPVSYAQQLHVGYVLTVFALIGPGLVPLLNGADFVPMTTQVWSAASMETLEGATNNAGQVTVSTGASETSLPLDVLTQCIVFGCLAGLGMALARILRGACSVQRIVRDAALIRRSGSLRILATDDALVPFSYWLPGACFIVVPSKLIARAADLAIALRHEGQHHRQGDTVAVYAMELLRGAFFLNPVTHVLVRHLRHLQEFACDEALIACRRVDVHAYCDCLVWVAQHSLQARNLPACMHMTNPRGTSTLSGRIRAVLERPTQYVQRRVMWAVSSLALLGMLASGLVLSESVQDRRVSLDQAQEMAAAAQAGSTFPIVVNEQVLAELNRFLATPDGRAFMRSALKRMAAHEALISAQLARHGLPQELLAVPLVESGYRNKPQGEDPRHGAGIWMFIKPVARQYGLTVEPGHDERLNVAAETDAAIRMFSDLYSEFGDWTFALLGYNGGRELVRRAVRSGGAADAFQAAQQGYENDPDYVARVMAAVIVLKNAHRLQLGTGGSDGG